jgi:2-polyprenyl-6-methoxyphenol 4-hydroxylase
MTAQADTAAKNSTADIVIVGGGMVGISAALLLAAQHPWKIVLIESQALSSTGSLVSPSFDARSTALSWSSRQIYESIGLWPDLVGGLSKIAQIHVSDRGHLGLTRIDAAEAEVEALGYVVENQRLGAALFAQLEQSNIEMWTSISVTGIKPLASGMKLTLTGDDGEQEVDTKLLVIADGAGSSTAQKLGIQSQTTPYDQSGIIANISLSKPHNGVAYERFTDQGPLALLPLSNFEGRPRSALVWTQPKDQADMLMAADDQSFLEHLQERFGRRLGEFVAVGERASYPLALTTSTEQVRSHLVIMGNAAHSLHPVAGQGFNLSLRDAATLASTLGETQEAIGSLETLQGYYQQQAGDQRNTVIFSDSLPRLFGLSSTLAAAGRNSGLLAMDLIPALRGNFARFGMGLATREAGHG